MASVPGSLPEPERLPDGTLRYLPDGTDRLITAAFDHSAGRALNIGGY